MDEITKLKWLMVADLVEMDRKPFSHDLSECILPRVEEVFHTPLHAHTSRIELCQIDHLTDRQLFFAWPRWMLHNPDRVHAANVIRRLVDTGEVDWEYGRHDRKRNTSVRTTENAS